MRVFGHELIHNEHLSEREWIYILGKYKKLNETLELLVNEHRGLDYTFKTSKQSEACYITLTIDKTHVYDVYEISIRNHSNYANSQYDKAFFMSEYQDWHHLRKCVLEDIVHKLEQWGMVLYPSFFNKEKLLSN